MKNKKVILSCFLCGSLLSSYAQSIGPQIINATGGSTVISGNTYEYSIGEMVLVNTFSSGSLVVTQGLLQPQEKETPSSIKDQQFFANNFSIYPNPSEQIIFLQPSFGEGGRLTFQLFDALGRIVKSGVFELKTGKEKQSINMSDLAVSSYALNISFQQHGRTYNNGYKIQKIN